VGGSHPVSSPPGTAPAKTAPRKSTARRTEAQRTTPTARFIDAFRAVNADRPEDKQIPLPVMDGRCHKALRDCVEGVNGAAPVQPEAVARAYVDCYDGRWGRPWLRKNLLVRNVIADLNIYLTRPAEGTSPTPAPARANRSGPLPEPCHGCLGQHQTDEERRACVQRRTVDSAADREAQDALLASVTNRPSSAGQGV
jgi:hypothetical protein